VSLFEEFPASLAGSLFVFGVIDFVSEAVTFIALFVSENFDEPEVAIIFRF
jgi:hypothetical protein